MYAWAGACATASEQSVEEVSTELSSLIDRLGIAEESLTGEQRELRGKAKQAAKENRNTVDGLSKRLGKLERETTKLEANAEQTAKLKKRVGTLETQVESLNTRIAATNERVTKLSRRVNSADSSGGGAQSAP